MVTDGLVCDIWCDVVVVVRWKAVFHRLFSSLLLYQLSSRELRRFILMLWRHPKKMASEYGGYRYEVRTVGATVVLANPSRYTITIA